MYGQIATYIILHSVLRTVVWELIELLPLKQIMPVEATAALDSPRIRRLHTQNAQEDRVLKKTLSKIKLETKSTLGSLSRTQAEFEKKYAAHLSNKNRRPSPVELPQITLSPGSSPKNSPRLLKSNKQLLENDISKGIIDSPVISKKNQISLEMTQSKQKVDSFSDFKFRERTKTYPQTSTKKIVRRTDSETSVFTNAEGKNNLTRSHTMPVSNKLSDKVADVPMDVKQTILQKELHSENNKIEDVGQKSRQNFETNAGSNIYSKEKEEGKIAKTKPIEENNINLQKQSSNVSVLNRQRSQDSFAPDKHLTGNNSFGSTLDETAAKFARSEAAKKFRTIIREVFVRMKEFKMDKVEEEAEAEECDIPWEEVKDCRYLRMSTNCKKVNKII